MLRLKTKARLFVTADLAPGEAVDLSAGQAHYLNNVMRAHDGDPVSVFNGRHGEWLASINGLTRNGGSLVVGEQFRPQGSEPDLWLAFALLKKSPTDFLVEKACELGVSRILPVRTRHTAATRINIKRLSANAIEAAEQCERLSVPHITEPVSLDRLIDEWPTDRRLLVPVESGAALPISEVRNSGDAGAILVGPEGGFAASELDVLGKLSFVVKVGLGPRILRAETAALAALACWQAFFGDWRERPPRRDGN